MSNLYKNKYADDNILLGSKTSVKQILNELKNGNSFTDVLGPNQVQLGEFKGWCQYHINNGKIWYSWEIVDPDEKERLINVLETFLLQD